MPQVATAPPMPPVTANSSVQSLRLQKEISIEAPLDIVWESVLERHRGGEMPDGTPMNWKFEAWPGGRWYRDLGEQAGHLWGHVQVIKPPKLLEITGPLFMSYAAISHVQYRLAVVDETTTLTLTHTAIGLIAPEHLEGVHVGWGEFLNEVQRIVERKSKA